jgi:fucose permease
LQARPSRATIEPPPARLRAARLAVTTIFFCWGADLATWLSRVPAIKQQLHLGTSGLSLALIGSSVGLVAATQIVARLVHRWSSARVVRWGAVAAAAMLVLPGLARGPVELTLALFAFGVGMGVLDIAMNTQAVAVDRGYGRSVISRIHGVYSIGVLAGAGAGALAAHLGVSPRTHFAIAALTLSIIGWVASAGMLGREADAPAESDPGEEYSRGRVPKSAVRAIIGLGAIAFCALFAEGAVDDWSGVYLHEVQHASLGSAPLGAAAFGALMAVGRFAGDAVIDAIGRARTLTWSALIASVGMTAAVLAPSAPVAIAAYGVVGFGSATLVPTAFGLAGNIAGTAPAWAISRVTTIGYLALFSSPPVIGFVATGTGLAGALAIPAGLLLIILALARLRFVA